MRPFSIGVSPIRALVAVLAGALSAASFPPLGLWPLAIVGIVLFLLMIRDLSGREAFNLSVLYGLVYGLGTMYWLALLFGVLSAGLIGIFALYFGVLGALIGLTRGRSPL